MNSRKHDTHQPFRPHGASRRWQSILAGLLPLLSVCALPHTGHAQAFVHLYTFPYNNGATTEGATPSGGLIQLSDGKLYGTTESGGVGRGALGTFYKIDTSGGNHTVLSTFRRPNTAIPVGGLIQATDGNLYGVSERGGAENVGTIYRIRPDGSGYTLLHEFSTIDGQGAYPFGRLLQATDGNLYGTTNIGGTQNRGTIFRLTLGGSFSIFHSFQSGEGSVPTGGLIQASNGVLYGTTLMGGNNDKGTIYSIALNGQLATLHSFNGIDGNFPRARLLQATDGRLYGATRGTNLTSSTGVIFTLNLIGTDFHVLHTLTADEGEGPGGLVQASDGNLYGTTGSGGMISQTDPGSGTIYRITTSGAFSVLHNFSHDEASGSADELIQATDGNLYGTAREGGHDGVGTVFALLLGSGQQIVGLSPDHATVGGAAFTLTVNGVGFDSTAVVRWNGTPLTTTFVSSTQLTAQVPATYIASVGEFRVSVAQGDVVSNDSIFTVDYPVPTITSINPVSTEAGHKSFPMTVAGTNFVSGVSQVYFNGSPLVTTFVSPTQLTAQVPASLLINTGIYLITVRNSSTLISNSVEFRIHITVLKITEATVTKDASGNYVAKVTLKNVGNYPTLGTRMILASLGAASASTPLPLDLGDLDPGATVSATLTFPASAGSSGQVVDLTERCYFAGSYSSSTKSVTLP